MTNIILMRVAGGLVPADEESKSITDKWPVGCGIRATVKRMRNLRFHRKFFALLQVGYEAWEPDEMTYNGQAVAKNFDRFRKDCIILAGFGDPVVNLKGEVRIEPRSLSFASMDEDEFQTVYSAIADVLLRRILTKYTRADLDQVVERIIGFT